ILASRESKSTPSQSSAITLRSWTWAANASHAPLSVFLFIYLSSPFTNSPALKRFIRRCRRYFKGVSLPVLPIHYSLLTIHRSCPSDSPTHPFTNSPALKRFIRRCRRYFKGVSLPAVPIHYSLLTIHRSIAPCSV